MTGIGRRGGRRRRRSPRPVSLRCKATPRRCSSRHARRRSSERWCRGTSAHQHPSLRLPTALPLPSTVLHATPRTLLLRARRCDPPRSASGAAIGGDSNAENLSGSRRRQRWPKTRARAAYNNGFPSSYLYRNRLTFLQQHRKTMGKPYPFVFLSLTLLLYSNSASLSLFFF
jgi:hypothetical protein